MSINWTAIANDASAIITDNPLSALLRRDSSTLDAQTIRIELMGASKAYIAQSDAAKQSEAVVFILGAADLDIAIGDRFNDADGNLIEVVFIYPNRLAATMAEGVVQQ